jgi:hypothetical protein
MNLPAPSILLNTLTFLIWMLNLFHGNNIHFVKKIEVSLYNKLDILYIVEYLNHNTKYMVYAITIL